LGGARDPATHLLARSIPDAARKFWVVAEHAQPRAKRNDARCSESLIEIHVSLHLATARPPPPGPTRKKNPQVHGVLEYVGGIFVEMKSVNSETPVELRRRSSKRIGIFGWGVVAPGAPDIERFASRLDNAESWLSRFDGFGPDNFLVGEPGFDFSVYRPWIEQRFPANRVGQLSSKMDSTTLYAIGAFIQALQQNDGIEKDLELLGAQAHVYIGTALGALPTLDRTSVAYHRAQRRWNRFWSAPERNAAFRAHQQSAETVAGLSDPKTIDDPDTREEAEDAWYAHWAARSDLLQQYLSELRDIEGVSVGADVDNGKLQVLREKRRRLANLSERYGAPDVPWGQVSANLLWNIANTPASQVSMLGHITGFSFAPVAACSTFAVSLKLAMDAIERGDAKLVVIGASDPAPHPLTVGAFYQARVLAADGAVSKPMSGLRGTHVAGGACIWIVGDLEYGLSRGYQPLGLEPLGVGVSADADHIITPSKEGPRAAIQQALAQSAVEPSAVGSWDFHATATPGDIQEAENLRALIAADVVASARKGTFGHGMGAAGGWELTAQYLGVAQRKIFPTTLSENEVHASIRAALPNLVLEHAVELSPRAVGKMSIGVGGINACVISRPYPPRGERA